MVRSSQIWVTPRNLGEVAPQLVRIHIRNMTSTPTPDRALPGQESAWSFPRPAIAQRSTRHLRIVHRETIVAETHRAVRTIETSHPPTYYFPIEDVCVPLVRSPRAGSLCEWKGAAVYLDVSVAGELLCEVAWSYPQPTAAFASIAGHIAFYAGPFDGCFVDGERVTPQPGGFYGGWITSDLAGPFKGVPGSRFW
jgi:uncharacterized protein (DUF427 family)